MGGKNKNSWLDDLIDNDDDADFDPDDDDLDDDDSGDGSNLVKQLRKQLRAKDKELVKITSAVKKMADASRKSTLSDLLKAKGVNEKAAVFIPKDVEATEEAISAWIDEYKDVLNLTPNPDEEGSDNEGSGSESGEQIPTHLQSAEVDGMRQISNAGNGAKPTGNQQELLRELQSSNLTPERLTELIHAAGGGRYSG